mmetsp:Transcript_42767/g.99677  ORF Transcript_42767/g.99677 Transcript_42767/m.99677 type:complete len:355 (-) Transcript_42767:159-1223(-)
MRIEGQHAGHAEQKNPRLRTNRSHLKQEEGKLAKENHTFPPPCCSRVAVDHRGPSPQNCGIAKFWLVASCLPHDDTWIACTPRQSQQKSTDKQRIVWATLNSTLTHHDRHGLVHSQIHACESTQIPSRHRKLHQLEHRRASWLVVPPKARERRQLEELEELLRIPSAQEGNHVAQRPEKSEQLLVVDASEEAPVGLIPKTHGMWSEAAHLSVEVHGLGPVSAPQPHVAMQEAIAEQDGTNHNRKRKKIPCHDDKDFVQALVPLEGIFSRLQGWQVKFMVLRRSHLVDQLTFLLAKKWLHEARNGKPAGFTFRSTVDSYQQLEQTPLRRVVLQQASLCDASLNLSAQNRHGDEVI